MVSFWYQDITNLCFFYAPGYPGERVIPPWDSQGKQGEPAICAVYGCSEDFPEKSDALKGHMYQRMAMRQLYDYRCMITTLQESSQSSAAEGSNPLASKVMMQFSKHARAEEDIEKDE